MFFRKVTLPCRLPKATQPLPRLSPRLTSYLYTRPYHLWLPLGIYTIWAKVVFIVATYRGVGTTGINT